MMEIREDQITIPISNEEGFLDWYVGEFIPEHLPEFHEALDNESLREMTKNARDEAIRCGFNDPSSQVHFVTMMWNIGPNFHHFPGFQEITNDVSQPGPERIERFYNEVTDDQAADAILGADDNYWYPDTVI